MLSILAVFRQILFKSDMSADVIYFAGFRPILFKPDMPADIFCCFWFLDSTSTRHVLQMLSIVADFQIDTI